MIEEFSFNDFWGLSFDIELVLRILIAACCGAFIGYERKRRQKEAGIRTHFIVALGSAMFAIVSKYGFLDIVAINGAQVDVSRVSSSIVTGVCFLGAGMIFVRSKSITGLTTAAGIWAVSAVGMSFGVGMYKLGLFSTFLIILIQYVLHKPLQKLEGPSIREMTCVLHDIDGNVERLKHDLEVIDKMVYFSQVEKRENGTILIKFNIRAANSLLTEDIYQFMKDRPYIMSLSC